MDEKSTQYGFNLTLDMPYEDAVPRVTAALKAQGFGVLPEIDVKCRCWARPPIRPWRRSPRKPGAG